ncbi:MAG: DUF3656 domain-containing protein, partial [Peptostreptococcaceae bacterium]
IDASIAIKLGQKPVLRIYDTKGNEASIIGDKIVEEAMKVALSQEKVETQMNKMGNTPYLLRNLEIDLDDNISLPISILNQMRRECIDLLSKSRIKVKNRNYKNKLVQYNPEVIDRNKDAKIRVKVKNLEQLESAIKYNVDVVYYEDIATLENALEMGKESKKRVIYSAPRIIRNKEYIQLEKVNKLGINSAQVGSLGAVDFFKDKYISIDYYLNAFNSETINHYKSQGANSLCMSQELNINEIKETIKYTNLDIEAVVYGYTPMMVTEYCPMGVLVRDCKKDKRVAKCKESVYALRDLKGEEYRVSQDVFCRST